MGIRGRFISFEGGEGVGKSTQAKLLLSSLQVEGRDALLTREPGGSPGAEEIRKLLVEGQPDRWTPLAETLLFLAARTDHVARTIEPALAAGIWVISDRFADSTFVYQGIARRLGMETVRHLQQAAMGDFAPDLTIVLDLDPHEGLKRAAMRGEAENRFERCDTAFHEQLRTGFLEIAGREPQRCAVVGASRSTDAIAGNVWRIVKARLSP